MIRGLPMKAKRIKKNASKNYSILKSGLLVFLLLISVCTNACTHESDQNKMKAIATNDTIKTYVDKENEVEAESDSGDVDELDTASSPEDSELSENMKELIARAEAGDSDAQNTLAYYYFNRFGVAKDYEKSFKWSLKSAENGNLASMFNVGYDYYYGFFNEVNYDMAFKWYEKAAEKLYPKALNALGEMYYSGRGTEKNIDLALDYTLQSAGLLHTYSLSNMGVLIDELELEQDSNMWFRLASKNYMIPSGANDILYERLVAGEYEIDIDDQLKTDKVPYDLIQDILFRYYSGTLYEYLEASSEPYKNFDLEDLNIDENTRPIMEYKRWYDASYLVDVDYDGSKELLVYQLDGTMGISSLRVLENKNGKFTYSEDDVYSNVMHGINGVVTYNNEKYFIVGNIDIGNRSILSVSIYSFDNGLLSDAVEIKTNEKSIEIFKTYQIDESYDELVKIVEDRTNQMFVKKYGSLLYEKVNELVLLDFDVNNDGKVEHYELEAMFYGTINRPLSLEFRDGLTSEEDLMVIDEVLKFGDYTVPIGLECFSHNGKNYLSVLSYDLGTNNHCFTTFLLEHNEINVIANHLIILNEGFIISNLDDFNYY